MKVGKIEGWDFSRVRTGQDPVLWEYKDMARQYIMQTDRVLDIGTGGGEVFFSLAPYFDKGVGVDHIPEMIETAQTGRGIETNKHRALLIAQRL